VTLTHAVQCSRDAVGGRALSNLRIAVLVLSEVIAQDLGQQPAGGPHLLVVCVLQR